MKVSILSLALSLAAWPCIADQTFSFTTILSGTNEVPPAPDLRPMRATFTLSGRILEYGSEPGIYAAFELRGPAGLGTNGAPISALTYHFVAPNLPRHPGGTVFS